MAKGKAAGGGNKAEMVRDALKTLGDPSPIEMQKYIKDKYGEEIPTTMLSSYKSNERRKAGASTGRGGRGSGSGDAVVGLKDLTTLRSMIDRVGASQVQAIVKVLSK